VGAAGVVGEGMVGAGIVGTTLIGIMVGDAVGVLGPLVGALVGALVAGVRVGAGDVGGAGEGDTTTGLPIKGPPPTADKVLNTMV